VQQFKAIARNNNRFFIERIFIPIDCLAKQYCPNNQRNTAAKLIGAQGLFINGGDQRFDFGLRGSTQNGSDSIELRLIKQAHTSRPIDCWRGTSAVQQCKRVVCLSRCQFR